MSIVPLDQRRWYGPDDEGEYTRWVKPYRACWLCGDPEVGRG